jgi:hypothetical protein
MTPRRKPLVLVAGSAILAGAGVAVLLDPEGALDAWHALRTGWQFEWMPEGVVPGSGRALNEAGEVAASMLGDPEEAMTWTPGSGLRRIDAGSCDHGSKAWAINGRGNIAGTCDDTGAFFWSPETGRIDIPGDGAVRPAAINNRDQVVGTASGGDWARAFCWDREAGVRELAVFGAEDLSFACAINDRGWIAGGVGADGVTRPVLWKPGSPPHYLDPPTPDGWIGGAEAVNEHNQVLLSVSKLRPDGTAEEYSSFLWTEERGHEAAAPIPEGHVDLYALALNDHGAVLLRDPKRGSAPRTTYLFSAGRLRELPPARRGVATHYTQINNRGWVAGYVDLVEEGGPGGRRRQGFLATPLRGGR